MEEKPIKKKIIIEDNGGNSKVKILFDDLVL